MAKRSRMGNVPLSASEVLFGEQLTSDVQSKADRWALARRFVDVAKVFYPDLAMDSVLLMPRLVFLEHQKIPAFEECAHQLKSAKDISVNKPAARILYLSVLWGERSRNPADGRKAALGAETEMAAKQRYSAAADFLTAHDEFHYIWIDLSCIPVGLRTERRGDVPSPTFDVRESDQGSGPVGVDGCPAAKVNFFEHLHPTALLVADAVLAIPPVCGPQHWFFRNPEAFTDLQLYSLNPWKALETIILQLSRASGYLYFCHGSTPRYQYLQPMPATRPKEGARGSSPPPGGAAAAGVEMLWHAGKAMEDAVYVALESMGLQDSGTPVERNWQSMLLPSYVLRKVREDVTKYCEAEGALKQSICTIGITLEQAKEFFGSWSTLATMGPVTDGERLAVLNLLCFVVAFVDWHCCPLRPNGYVKQLISESLADQGRHLELWMKDLSPPDLEEVLRVLARMSPNRVRKLTVGSSHTGGAGLGRYLHGNTALTDLEVEWEGMRDVGDIARSLSTHPALLRLNLTHNSLGPRGAGALAVAISVNRSLTELDLRENHLGPQGIATLASALPRNSTLRNLYLQDNCIGDDGAISITEAFTRDSKLVCLCLDGNDIRDDGGKTLCVAASLATSLAQLSVTRNFFSDAIKEQLLDAWRNRDGPDAPGQAGWAPPRLQQPRRPSRWGGAHSGVVLSPVSDAAQRASKLNVAGSGGRLIID